MSNSKHSNTKERILEIAIDLFSIDGYSGVSIRDITGRVGIKESSFYKHYKSKEELMENIFNCFIEELMKPTQAIDIINVEDILKSISPEIFLVNSTLAFIKRFGDDKMEKLFRILSIEQYRNQKANKIILEIFRTPVKRIEIIFQKMIDLKLIKKNDVSILAQEYQYPMYSMLIEYIISKHNTNDDLNIEKRLKDHIHFFWNCIHL